jgi:hypothetical protein
MRMVEARGPLFYGVAIEEDGRILVAVMQPSFLLAVRDPKINQTIMQAGWPQGEFVNQVVRATAEDE